MKSSKLEQVQDVPITADHWDVPIPLCPRVVPHDSNAITLQFLRGA